MNHAHIKNRIRLAIVIALMALAGWVWYMTFTDSSFIPSSDDNPRNDHIPQRTFNDNALSIAENISANYPIDTFKAQLDSQARRMRSEWEKADLVERIALERELTLLQIKTDNYMDAYKEKISLLMQTHNALNGMHNYLTSHEIQQAQAALLSGNTQAAYRLFVKVESSNRGADNHQDIHQAAEAAYRRGNIDFEKLDYRKAYRHYRHAAMYNPNNIDYLLAAGKVADSIALYGNAINYFEAALHARMQTNDHSPAQLRPLWIDLGNAWNSKGDADKAIGYFQLALNSDTESYGENHLNVAMDYNFLGAAWENKGKIDTALAHYRQALKIFESVLGHSHAGTMQVRDSINKLSNTIR